MFMIIQWILDRIGENRYKEMVYDERDRRAILIDFHIIDATKVHHIVSKWCTWREHWTLEKALQCHREAIFSRKTIDTGSTLINTKQVVKIWTEVNAYGIVKKEVRDNLNQGGIINEWLFKDYFDIEEIEEESIRSDYPET